MFFPFTDYKRVTFSSETEGANQTKYTTTAKSLLCLEVERNVAYSTAASGTVVLGGVEHQIYGLVDGKWVSSPIVVKSGVNFNWRNNNPFGAENITLHIFELPN